MMLHCCSHLHEALVSKWLAASGRSSTYRVRFTAAQAADVRDGCAKAAYGQASRLAESARLFGLCVSLSSERARSLALALAALSLGPLGRRWRRAPSLLMSLSSS